MLKLSLCTAALFATLVVSASAATVTWKLAARVHVVNATQAQVKTGNVLKPKGFAISALTSTHAAFNIDYLITCAKGTARPPVRFGSFVSYGKGAKVPVKLDNVNPDYCTVSAHATGQSQFKSIYLSIWRR
jgi:hypothetical protein